MKKLLKFLKKFYSTSDSNSTSEFLTLISDTETEKEINYFKKFYHYEENIENIIQYWFDEKTDEIINIYNFDLTDCGCLKKIAKNKNKIEKFSTNYYICNEYSA